MPEVRIRDRTVDPTNGGQFDPSGWVRWSGFQCYGGRGGVEIPGMDPAPGQMSLEKCQGLCEMTAECGGIQVQDCNGACSGGCWLRAEVDLADCYSVPEWNMYTHPRYHSKHLSSSGFFSFFRDFHREHGTVAEVLLIIIVALIVAIIGLAIWYSMIKKKKKRSEKVMSAMAKNDREEFLEMDRNHDGVVTDQEFADFRRDQRSCGRSCYSREEEREKDDGCCVS
jgi:hypothetical protein